MTLQQFIQDVYDSKVSNQYDMKKFIENNADSREDYLSIKEYAQNRHDDLKETFKMKQMLGMLDEPRPTKHVTFGDSLPKNELKKRARIMEVLNGLAYIKDFIHVVDDKIENSNKTDTVSEIGSNDIWRKYWHLRNDKGIKEDPAYEKIENWLLNELRFSREEIKQKFNITLTKSNFTRSARNQPQRF